MRQEATAAYQSPFLYSIGLTAPITKYYRLKFNHSKNFRIPTFNDLYWVVGGNTDLQPEQAVQNEFGQELTFEGFKLTATGYHNRIRHMIQWKPEGGNWSPENVANVRSYGVEFLLEVSRKLRNHRFDLASTYAYTVSTNEALNTQLTYVPFHKYTASLTYTYGGFMLNYQYLFNGSVYTLNDNQTKLPEYLVSNVGVFWFLGKKRQSSVGLQALNCWNQSYQSVPGRPLPGRNFQVNLIIKL
jgi:iron complex outermembrane receptor protein